MKAACKIATIAAAAGRPMRGHLRHCPHCRTRMADEQRVDALMRQSTPTAVGGRAPETVINAVRNAAAAPEPRSSPRRLAAITAITGVAAAAALALALAVPDATTPAVDVVSQPPVEKLALPAITPGAELPQVDHAMAAAYESEFALLAADFRRGTGRR